MKTPMLLSLAAAALLPACQSRPHHHHYHGSVQCYTAEQVIHVLHQPHGITVGDGEPEAYMSPTLRRFMNEGTDRPARPLY
ncbi:hypothetical protein KA057_02200 [Candidatus Gracilibacteria bacterium]|nr:hypothetical protein [Candidatus Gracilibacteria bacterium]